MVKLILLNYETGTFFECYGVDEMKTIIANEIDNGADLENLGLYKADTLRIKENINTSIEYSFYRG